MEGRRACCYHPRQARRQVMTVDELRAFGAAGRHRGSVVDTTLSVRSANRAPPASSLPRRLRTTARGPLKRRNSIARPSASESRGRRRSRRFDFQPGSPDTAAPMVILRVGVDRATFDGVQWRSDDRLLAEALEVLTPRHLQSPSVPRFDVFVAEHLIPLLEDAEILDVSPPGPGDDVGVVY